MNQKQPPIKKPMKTRWLNIVSVLRSWIMPLGVITLIGGIGYGFWRIQASNPAAVTPESKESNIELRFYNVELRGRKEGTRFWTILADEVEVSRDARYVYFQKKPRGEFYNLKDWEKTTDQPDTESETKRRGLKWDAGYAEYDTQQERLTMKKDVNIVTDTKDKLKTDDLLWEKQTETITSHSRSKVLTHKKTYMEADNLEAKTKLKELVLEGKVYIEMDVGKEKNIKLDLEEKMK